MAVVADSKAEIERAIRPVGRYFRQPVELIRGYERADLRPDLVAGLTVAVIMLPQAIAFALIAELPPEMGLYAAVVGSIIGALWGSSHQIHNGPTNANSLLVLSALLSASFVPGTLAFAVAAGMMAVMAGLLQLVLGLARLGVLVNFVSHSVVVGFSAGAGVLIAVKQISPLLGVEVPGGGLRNVLAGLGDLFAGVHGPTAALGLGSMLLLVLLPRIKRRFPAALTTMIVASVVVFIFNLHNQGVSVIGRLPSGLPPLAQLPLFDLDFIRRLSTGALAVGAIGLVQTIAMARSIATQTGQRIDSNQEFVGQGLANIASGLFSGFATAGSFSRSAVNLQANARTPVAAIFSGIFTLVAMLVLAPLAVFLPRAALAGVLVVIGLKLVDYQEIRRILRGTRGDAIIMLVTLLGTLLLPIELAVLAGILLSFVHYTLKTSMPKVHQVLPDDEFHHFVHQPQKDNCPQLSIIDVLGDLYFGAVNHIEEKILKHLAENPEQRFLLIRMNRVNHCDYSGIHMLENVVKAYRDAGGDVFIVRVEKQVLDFMRSTGFYDYLGSDNFLPDDEAIGHIFHHVLDPAVCIYECPVRAFEECQNLPKRIDLVEIPDRQDIPEKSIIKVSPQALWQELRGESAAGNSDGEQPRPLVVDVREAREFKQGHIPEAQLVPLPTILLDTVKLPNDRRIIVVCRSGRRSTRAAYALQKIGCMNVAVLEGGMAGWEAADLLEAVER
jgi:SulP family sulfate permease